ncbi:hypothetical protein Q4575_01330 [Psychrosphaera sp. 1_MG-2023]|nr:hypothetical protein [Psychrosphaera sp. 1_MG-2023]MDO6718020.1 hypothetical protein [Psychrosphaera sp. 1_MG-2023]
MLELLFLLLPAAVIYGWVMGKHSAKKELLEQQLTINNAINSSVSLLLNEDQEQAFDRLIQYFDDTPSNIDNYLTLAKLFRKKGEIDKAIAIHEGLVKTDQITIPQYELEEIQLELAQDFLSAGMLERAQNTLTPLLTSQHASEALLGLLHIFEQTREWQAGVESYLAADAQLLSENCRQLVSHFYCEIGDAHDNYKSKKQAYKRALKVNRKSVRSLLALSKLYLIVNNKQKSRELVVTILDQEPSFAPALFNIAPECFVDEFEQTAWLFWLIKEKNIKSVTAHSQMTDYIVKEKGIEAGRSYIIEHLQDQPSVRGFAKLIELEKEFFMSDPHFKQLQSLITRYIELKPLYECNSCGFTTNHFSWRCPACNNWQTIKPLAGLDGI